MHLSWFMCPFGKFLHLCQPESFTFLSLFPPPSSSFKYRLLEVQYLLVVIKSICPSTTVASWSHIWPVLCLVLQRINIQDIANIINKHLVAMVIKSICPSTKATSLTQIWPVLCLVLQWMSKQSTTCTSNCKGGVQKTPFSFNHVLDVPCRPLEGLERDATEKNNIVHITGFVDADVFILCQFEEDEVLKSSPSVPDWLSV